MMISKAETMPENHISANYKIKICGNDEKKYRFRRFCFYNLLKMNLVY